MDDTFLKVYTEELDYLRRMSGEFARAYPAVARRLDLDEFECQDPWVERLLEGVAFLTSRVKRELDGGMPRLAQSMIGIAAPHMASPFPSTGICRLEPAADLSKVVAVPAGTTFRSKISGSTPTPCTWRTLRDMALRPMALANVVLQSRGDTPANIVLDQGEHSWLEITINVGSDRSLAAHGTPLTFQLHGPAEFPGQILRCLRGSCTRVAVCDEDQVLQWLTPADLLDSLDLESSVDLNLSPTQKLGTSTLFMQRFSSLPQQFHAFALKGIDPAALPKTAGTLRFVFMFDQSFEDVGSRVRTEMFSLHSVPVINLFKRRGDRVVVDALHESQVVIIDRTRPMDYELYDIERLNAIGKDGDDLMEVRPMYDLRDADATSSAFYSIHRKLRLDSEASARHGDRSSYRGTDAWISITPPRGRQMAEFAQLSMDLWCTNRDLPLLLEPQAQLDPTNQIFGLSSCLLIQGPSMPRLPEADSSKLWSTLGQLGHTHLRMIDETGSLQAATAVQSSLASYVDSDDHNAMQQIQAISSITGQQVTRRIIMERRAAEVRGMAFRIEITDEALHSGVDIYTLPLVLSRFMQRMVPINSFLETTVTNSKGEVLFSWKPRSGCKSML